MSRTVSRADPPDQSLRDLECLLTATEQGAFSALDLVLAAGELAVRRVVHGFSERGRGQPVRDRERLA